MSYSPKQWRAINHYLKKGDLRPELSAFPVVRYTDKKTGKPGEIHISNVEDLYTADRERAKREARVEKRTERKQPVSKQVTAITQGLL